MEKINTNQDPLSPRNTVYDEHKASMDRETILRQDDTYDAERANRHYYEALDFDGKLETHINQIETMLQMKNRKYGNSALEPTRIFSSADAIEQIKVRLDDKLSRLKNQQHDEDEDVIDDLIGYLFLLKMAIKTKANS